MIIKRFHREEDIYNRYIVFAAGEIHQLNCFIRDEHTHLPEADYTNLLLADSDHAQFFTVESAIKDHSPTHYIVVVIYPRGGMLSALAHEVLHHVFETCRIVGIPPGPKTEEAYCYYFDWVFRKCVEALQEGGTNI